MPSSGRDRITVDLRGLGEAVRVHAAARRLTLAAFARSALVEVVGRSPRQDKRADLRAAVDGSRTVKITLRLPEPIADALMLRANEAGLSYGECLMCLLQDAPTLQSAAERAGELVSFAASNDRLATMATDLKELVRFVRMADAPNVNASREEMTTLIGDLRLHLGLASELMTALRPAARPVRPDAHARGAGRSRRPLR